MNAEQFDSIQLEEMDQVKLMNRTDTKYWFHRDHLPKVFSQIENDYLVLKIDNVSEMPYATTYYDTIDSNMFIAHHNGKLNRYKVRRRSYVSTGVSFLEVKFKSNKGRTIKKRIAAEYGNTLFNEQERLFLEHHLPFSPIELYPCLFNKFSRVTLVNKNFKERCTIDLDLHFQNNNKVSKLDNLVIVEIKSDGKSGGSPLAIALREQRIKSSGFSKYCIGSTLTDASLKRNAFKGKIRNIEKTIQSEINLYNFK